IYWMTDEWLASQTAAKPPRGRDTRRAVVQLRRRHLKIVEMAIVQPPRMMISEQNFERAKAIFWRSLITMLGILLLAPIVRVFEPASGVSLWLFAIYGFSLASFVLFTYYVFVAYLWRARNAEYLSNIVGYLTVVDNMNPIVEAILKSARRTAGSHAASAEEAP